MVLGLIPLLVSAALLWFAWKLAQRGHLLGEVPRSLTGSVEPGVVKLSGTVRCDEPLRAPTSLRDCVFYRFEIEEEVVRSDQHGRERRAWQRASKGSDSCAFELDDGSGSVLVDPRGAVVDAEATRAGDVSSGYSKSEAAALAGPSYFLATHRGRSGRVRRDEQIVGVGADVVVLGRARLDDERRRVVVGPGRDDAPFYISVRSESRVRRTALAGATVVLVLAALFAASIGLAARFGESLRADGVSDAEADLVVTDVVIGAAAVLAIGAVWWLWRAATRGRAFMAAPPPEDNPLIE